MYIYISIYTQKSWFTYSVCIYIYMSVDTFPPPHIHICIYKGKRTPPPPRRCFTGLVGGAAHQGNFPTSTSPLPAQTSGRHVMAPACLPWPLPGLASGLTFLTVCFLSWPLRGLLWPPRGLALMCFLFGLLDFVRDFCLGWPLQACKALLAPCGLPALCGHAGLWSLS